MKKTLALLTIPFLFACDNEPPADPREPTMKNFERALNEVIPNKSNLRACAKITGYDGSDTSLIINKIGMTNFDLVISSDDNYEMMNKLYQVGFLTDFEVKQHPRSDIYPSLRYFGADFTEKAYKEADVYKKEDRWLGNKVFRYTLCTGSPKLDKIIQATRPIGGRVKILAKIKMENANEWMESVHPELLEREAQFELVLMHDGWVEESQLKIK